MISALDKVPPFDTLVLVVGHTHTGIALAKYRQKEKGKTGPFWEIQPFNDVIYWTYGGITHWDYITLEPTKPTPLHTNSPAD